MKTKSVDMLNGSLYKNIFKFSIPVILTGILHLLFNSVDLIVVGRFCGSKSVAAVGATGSLVALIVNLFLGISVGSGVTVAQSIGAKDKEKTERAVHTSIPLAVIIGIVLTVIGFIFAKPLLNIMGTPKDIIDKSALYLKIYFFGITLRMLYVFEAAILRAAGDTKTPLLSLTMGGILNAGFNLFFVLVLNMDVDGVAYGTIISEGISSLICLFVLFNRTDEIKFSLKKLCFDLKIVKKILGIGIPMGIQNSMFSIANTIVQSSINTFGSVVVAGNAASGNIMGFIDAVSGSFATAAVNFMGQNIGAANYKRAKKIVPSAALLSACCEFVFCSIIFIFSKQLLSIYITDSNEAIAIGIKKLMIVGLPYFLCSVQSVFSGSLRGMGKGLMPMASSICGICVFRIIWLFTVFKLFPTIETVYITYPLSWILTMGIDFILYKKAWKDFDKKQELKRRQSEQKVTV